MDSLVSQHPAYSAQQFSSLQPDQHSYPSSSSSSSRQPNASHAAYAYDHRYASRYQSSASSSSSSSQHQHQTSPALQIQTATPAPHEHEPDEQTAHPSRASGPAASSSFASTSSAEYLHQQQQQHQQEQQQQQDPPQQSIADALTEQHGGLSRPLTLQERELLEHLDRLKFFLATAPSRWNDSASAASSSSAISMSMLPNSGMGAVPAGHPHSAHPALNRFLLPNQEYVSCVLWGGLYHITGTDIVRALVFRFEAFGRPVRNMKKFEEGVFSDLRNLKPGVDACLEEPKSPFLDLLFKYQCIRTQKKQKVFYWFSVPHDRLFLDALERDLKREKMGLEPTTVVVGEPALSFTYDPKRSLYEQFSKAHGARDGEGELEAAVRHADEARGSGGEESSDGRARSVASSDAEQSASDADDSAAADDGTGSGKGKKRPSALSGPNSPFFPMFSLFEGSPTYKQRRKKVPKGRKPSPPSSADSATHGHPLAHGHPQVYAQMAGTTPAFREPHMDRFGRDVLRLSAEEMFAATARGDFTAAANPDVVVSHKERQRRAMEAQAHEFASAQGKLPFLSGLSGPGVSGGLPASSSVAVPASSASAYAQGGQDMDLVYGTTGAGQPLTASSLAGSMDYTGQQQQQQQYGQAMHQRPQLGQRHTYPLVDFQQQARSGTDQYASLQAAIPTGWAPPGGDATGMGVGVGGEAPRTKAFVCPLFSCGRMFKRMEHLRRHLRTHTLERPFQCEQCQKRFSRSDNLAQHVRTHDRRAALAAAAEMGVNVNGMGMAVGVPDGGEADAEDELDELGSDDIDGELQYLSGVGGITSVQMCEVEVEGQVHEVHGDEEGLLMTNGSFALTSGSTAAQDDGSQAQEMFYDSTGQILRASPETSPYLAGQPSPDAQWATVPSQHGSQQQGSPAPTSAFSTSTVGGSGLQLAHAARLDASYHTAAVGDYVTSISAPSHKLTFDHATLYPAELALGGGPGPIRRHRSATPSVPRYGESIRRPYSAALSDSGNGNNANGASAPATSRSYHPYAVPGHHAQVSHSAQSSPMAYTVPLGSAVAGGYDARHAAHSRSSSSGQLQEQMRHMLSLDQMEAAGGMAQYAPAHTQEQAYAGMYRTDSPMQFNGVGEAYEMEMAHQQPAYAVGLGDPQAMQYASQHPQQQQQHSNYYPQPHHSL